MNYTEYKITLDLQAMSSPVILHAKQGETAVRIIATLMNAGVPYEITGGCYAVFSGKKPDKNILWNVCTIEGDKIIYEFTEQTVAVVGTVPVQLRLYSAGGKLLCSPDFTLIVEANAVGDDEATIVSSNEVTALAALITETAALKAEVQDLMDALEETLQSIHPVKNSYVTLLANKWEGSGVRYSQVVTLAGVTENSQVDLKLNDDQIEIFREKDLAFTATNRGGVVTVTVVGQKPENDYTIQVTITEVEFV